MLDRAHWIQHIGTYRNRDIYIYIYCTKYRVHLHIFNSIRSYFPWIIHPWIMCSSLTTSSSHRLKIMTSMGQHSRSANLNFTRTNQPGIGPCTLSVEGPDHLVYDAGTGGFSFFFISVIGMDLTWMQLNIWNQVYIHSPLPLLLDCSRQWLIINDDRPGRDAFANSWLSILYTPSYIQDVHSSAHTTIYS